MYKLTIEKIETKDRGQGTYEDTTIIVLQLFEHLDVSGVVIKANEGNLPTQEYVGLDPRKKPEYPVDQNR